MLLARNISAGRLRFTTDVADAMQGADVLVLINEWKEFRALDLKRLHQQMAGNVLVDLQNVYVPEDVREAGFRYSSIGRQRSSLQSRPGTR